MRIARDENIRQIEFAFRREKEIRLAVEEAKSGGRGFSPSGQGAVADPTAAEAIKRAEEIRCVDVSGVRMRWPERWLSVVGAVRDWCGRDAIRAGIYRRRYVTPESRFSAMRSLHIAERTYYAALEDIQNYAVQCACQAQLIKVF